MEIPWARLFGNVDVADTGFWYFPRRPGPAIKTTQWREQKPNSELLLRYLELGTISSSPSKTPLKVGIIIVIRLWKCCVCSCFVPIIAFVECCRVIHCSLVQR